ncbi:MAG: ATP-binding protein [Lachnospiraceae bacterium]|nr:ATP-binding protein [Lachnospiraceae bacterium]
MSELYKKKVAGYLFGAYCFYLVYNIFFVLYLGYSRLWLVVPTVSILVGFYALFVRREKYSLQAYMITVMTCINIMMYAVMTNEFTEVFTVLCAAACMISFYHIPMTNYIMLGFTTLFVLYQFIFCGEWQAFLTKGTSIVIVVRIVSVYVLQTLLIVFIRYQQRMQKRLEEKAQELEIANQAKSDFLANMSHEIRTPMNAIAGMVELALRSEEIPEKERDYLYDIQSAGRDLLAIINDLLDFSKIDSGDFKISEEPYEITSIIHDVTNVVQAMMGDKKVELCVEMNPKIPAKLKGDGLRIKQITMNLLGNAAKYTEEGRILLKVDFKQESDAELAVGQKIQLQVSVEDTGIGISEEKLQSLFMAFTQADSRRSRAFGGNGLGLAITKKLIELMHGTLDAVSEVGKGSTFSYALEQEVIDAAPCMGTEKLLVQQTALQKENMEKAQRKKKPDMTSFQAPDVKILIVDDNRVNQKVAEGLLRPYHMQIDTASSGAQAIEMVKSKEYDLILMDYMMPEMDGIDATKMIRAMEEEYYKQLPIVALSANAINGVAEMFIEGGMNDFVAKPIEMRVMDAKLKKWLPEDKILSKAKLVYSR